MFKNLLYTWTSRKQTIGIVKLSKEASTKIVKFMDYGLMVKASEQNDKNMHHWQCDYLKLWQLSSLIQKIKNWVYSGMSMEASSSVDNRGPWTRGVSTESKEEDYYIVKMHLIMSSSPTPNI